MEKLTPIRQIKVNFGTPVEITSPDLDEFYKRIEDEVIETREDPYAAAQKAMTVWKASITKEEWEKFKSLQKKEDKALKEYDPAKHGNNSKEFFAYQKADEETREYFDSIGHHMCFECSYYLADEELTKSRSVAVCECSNPCRPVRPMGLACKRFTTGGTKKMEQAQNRLNDILRRDPNARKAYESFRLTKSATNFAKTINESPSAAFYVFLGNRDFYENLYEKRPLAFASTQYPSFPLFLEAFTRWKKMAEIHEENGKVSIVLDERKGGDKEYALVPPKSRLTSEN